MLADLSESEIFDLTKQDRDKLFEQLHREVFKDIDIIARKVDLRSLQDKRIDPADKEFRIWIFYTDAIGTGLVSTLRGQNWAVEEVRFDTATNRFTKHGLGEPNRGWDGWDKFLEDQASRIVRLDDFPSLDPDGGFIAIEFRNGDEYRSKIFPRSAIHKADHPIRELCATLANNFGPFLCGNLIQESPSGATEKDDDFTVRQVR
ncbi:MAG TPA: hypothetical protein PKE66_11225 [Pyrinomonadaceae bacterium]|nr:hypothetical protein [Pyrinomonadaceae bacterium]